MIPPEFIPLAELLANGRDAGVPVASEPDGVRSWDDLLRGISGWTAAYAARPEPRFALHHEDTWTFTCALLGAWAAGKHVVIPGDALPATFAALALPRLTAPLPGVPAAMPGRPAAPAGGALTVYTSGSTGKPASFVKSFAQLGSEIETLERTFGRELGASTLFSTVSHQHIYGLLFKVLWPLCAGRVFHIPDLFYPEELLATARTYRTAALISSPAHLKRLSESLDWPSVEDRWRAVFSSGGPLAWDAAQKTRRLFGRAPLEVYGSSETGGVAWRERGAVDATWRNFSNVELRLEDGSGALSVRSPHLPDGEWFTTSDLARLTDGGFELLGRRDRIVKVREKRVSLTAVEDALLEGGLATEACVLPLRGGQDQLGAVLVPSAEGLALPCKDLQERLRSRLAERVEGAAIPRRWRFVETLPLNASGKVTEESLLRLFETRPLLPEVLAVEPGAAGAVSLKLRLPKDLFYFDGHFPASPILPGVVQLDWAVRYGKEHLGVRGTFQKVEILKFQQVLQPGDEFALNLSFDAAKGRLKFEYQSARGRHSSGSLYFQSELA